jgi:hypothetical protein
VIHIVNALRANLIRKEVEEKILREVMPRLDRWDTTKMINTPNLFRVSRLLQRIERLRMRRWAPWKDRR